jgi:2-polyprenyl-3-methyl-5-hydroxy-6-metoxy-1,4-benzoquinol methylase
MKQTLENTGERMIPEHHKGQNIYGAHIGRYQAGLNLVKDKIVLDIACGSGYGTKLMSEQAKKVYGVDIDADTIAYAKENYGAKNVDYKLGNGIAIPLDNASVDVVVSYETIEHIEDYKAFMKEVKRVLRPGGILLLSTPNDTEYAEGNHFHLYEFNYTELKELVGKYFKFRKDYFQTLWMYSSIVPARMQSSEWSRPILTTNTVPLKPEQCIYFFMICSDTDITDEIKPAGIIGEHFRQRDHQDKEKKRQEMRQKIDELSLQIRQITNKTQKVEEELRKVYASKSWKLTGILRKIHKLPKSKK